jgi:hypothetical protein
MGVIGAIAAVALTRMLPLREGGWVFAGLIILARVFAAGIVTVRSTIWRYNYPRHLRGQMVGRISMIASAVLALTTLVGSKWLDKDDTAYVWLYLIAALTGLLGVWQFSHIRVRRERSLLRQAQLLAARPESMAQTDEANVLNYAPPAKAGFISLVRQGFALLRADRRFREYQRWQMMAGFSFMMLQPPLVFLVSRRLTDPDRDYTLSTVVLQIIPLVVSMLATPFWAPLFDRMLISKFRVIQGCSWFGGQLLVFLGAYLGNLYIIMAAEVVIGVSISAGNLVWNLGHNEFAPPEKAGEYMAVHVMLTGLRGFIAPFAGTLLFKWMGQSPWLFMITAGINFAAWMGYVSMWREDLRHPPVRVGKHHPLGDTPMPHKPQSVEVR